MQRLTKKILLFLVIVTILVPVGIIVPHYFSAGKAWGEWSPSQVKEQKGYEPAGMKKVASIYNAPLPDYNAGKQNTNLYKQSFHYVLSGAIGIGIILLLTFGANKLIQLKKNK